MHRLTSWQGRTKFVLNWIWRCLNWANALTPLRGTNREMGADWCMSRVRAWVETLASWNEFFSALQSVTRYYWRHDVSIRKWNKKGRGSPCSRDSQAKMKTPMDQQKLLELKTTTSDRRSVFQIFLQCGDKRCTYTLLAATDIRHSSSYCFCVFGTSLSLSLSSVNVWNCAQTVQQLEDTLTSIQSTQITRWW